jgi:1-acyl-sn-glycerol-3-phosphate acyltransferase
LGRFLTRIFFKIEIQGVENYPKNGPLLIVGNHTAIMETVLLICYAPWQIEMLGAADIPHEMISQIFSKLFGFIPVKRGHVDRPALKAALDVLGQQGIIGIFPEGGIWEPGLMRAQTGVAWLSYRGYTPVLPIGFSGTLGALKNALSLKRPSLLMKIGTIMSPLQLKSGVPRKILFEDFSEEVMANVRSLLLPNEPSVRERIKDERFKLNVTISDNNTELDPPTQFKILHGPALAKLFHRPSILKIFHKNLNLPVDALQNLHEINDPNLLSAGLNSIIGYLNNENPYFLSYRFGAKQGEDMEFGLKEMLNLTKWAAQQNYKIKISPIRYFFSLDKETDIVQIKQGVFKNWM